MAPHMLPGYATSVPIPRMLRSVLAMKAAVVPQRGPSNTAHRTFTMCCTGTHRANGVGITMSAPPTTANPASRPVIAISRTRLWFFCTSILIVFFKIILLLCKWQMLYLQKNDARNGRLQRSVLYSYADICFPTLALSKSGNGSKRMLPLSHKAPRAYKA